MIEVKTSPPEKLRRALAEILHTVGVTDIDAIRQRAKAARVIPLLPRLDTQKQP